MSNTAVYNVRLDIRALATLHKYYKGCGIEFDSISSLNRRAIESLADQLVSQCNAQKFHETTEAINYFEASGLMGPLRTRGNRPLIKQMQRETLSLEGFSESYLDPKSTVSNDQFEKARNILNQRREDQTSSAILGPNPGEAKVKKEGEK